jgi:3-oxoadipate enol-lactonase
MMGEITTSDGIRIHYEVEGPPDAPPLLFSNSLGTNLHMWDGQMNEAARRGFRAARYDQRGHGQSEAPKGEYSIERLGRDVIDLLDALKIERTAFLGLSMGGMTGIWLAMHHPRRFSRLALANTAVWMPPRDLWEGRMAAVRAGGMAAVAEGVVERWFTPAFRERNPREVDRIRAMILTTAPAGYIGCMCAVRDIDLRDRLGIIEAPTLVVIGAHDPATPPERGQYIVERIPGAQKAVLDTAHLSNVEDPEAFNRAVFGFLAGGRR